MVLFTFINVYLYWLSLEVVVNLETDSYRQFEIDKIGK